MSKYSTVESSSAWIPPMCQVTLSAGPYTYSPPVMAICTKKPEVQLSISMHPKTTHPTKVLPEDPAA